MRNIITSALVTACALCALCAQAALPRHQGLMPTAALTLGHDNAPRMLPPFVTARNPQSAPLRSRAPLARSPLRSPLEGVELRGACTGVLSEGMYHIGETMADFQLLGNPTMPAYGGVEQNGKYYCLTGKLEVETYDSNTWEFLRADPIDINIISTGLSLDPSTGRTYGCYSNVQNGNTTYQLGWVDFENLAADGYKRTHTIAEIGTRPWNAVACDGHGNVYAIDADGQLLVADTSTGQILLVGDTGLKPYYMSSATFDHKSGRLFYALSGLEGFGLYEISTLDATPTLINDFGGYPLEIFGMYATDTPLVLEAPAAPTDLAASFPDGSLSGTISFNAPAQLVNGTPCTDEVAYEVFDGDGLLAEGSVVMGQGVSLDVTFPALGEHPIAVSLNNDKGRGPAAKLLVYAGPDAPQMGPVQATYANGDIVLTWPAATRGEHDGYFDPAQVTYTVKRHETGQVLASGLTQTTYTVHVGQVDTFAEFSFEVTGQHQGACSRAATTAPMLLGALVPPYANAFDNESCLANYTIIDSNNDGKTWQLRTDGNCVAVDWNGYLDMDDWLITPAVRLRRGCTYMVSVDVKCAAAQLPENIEVKWGSAPTVEAMTNELIANTEVTEANKYVTLQAYLTPETDGDYHIGFHGISPKYRYTLYLTNIQVAEGINALRPAAATDLAVTPGLYGALEATVGCKAPTLDFQGNALAELDRVEVSRDGQLIHTFQSPQPGQQLSCTDVLESSGTHTYSVAAVNQYGTGEAVTREIYVGVNAPAAPGNATFAETDTEGEVLVTWNAPATDCDGFPLRPDDVTYTLVSNEGEVAHDIRECSYRYRAVGAGDQKFVQLSVYAVTPGGTSADFAFAGMRPVGHPFTSPYAESFTNAALGHIMGSEQLSGSCSWNLFNDATFTDVTSQDGDNGFAAFRGSDYESSASFFTGKISLAGLDNPMLSFYTFVMGADPNLNSIDVDVRPAGQDWQRAGSVTVQDLGRDQGWERVMVSLAQWKGQVVEVRFIATTRSYTYTLLDNVAIDTPYACNLAALRLQAPTRVMTGTPFDLTVSLINSGYEDVQAYTLDLYRDGEKVDTKDGGPLRANAKADFTFSQTLGVMEPDDVTYWARIVCDGDQNASDNATDDVAVRLMQNSYPTVTLTGGMDEAGAATLEWAKPDLSASAELVQEDFENAEAWSTYVDGWTFEDHDGLPVGMPANVEWPGITLGQTTGSFFVFDHMLDYDAQMQAHSGQQMLMCLYAYNMKQIDDWAISPALSGREQTVSFWARSYSREYPETIEVYYRTSPDGEFILLDRYEDLSIDWEEFTAYLPEGACNFAIRSCAEDNFLLFLDDFVFEASAQGGNLQLLGYNVYRNGRKVNDQPLSQPGWTDPQPVTEPTTYVVTAVYDRGESRPSNEITVTPSGIGQTLAPQGTETLYDLMGRPAGSDGGKLPAGVYVRVRSGQADKVKK